MNPWGRFAEDYEKGSKVSGAIKSITDFGIFIGLEGGIDGLVHLSDISWDDIESKLPSRRNFNSTVVDNKRNSSQTIRPLV